MKEDLKYLLMFMIAGAAFCIGIRVVEWAIPKPETRLYVCIEGDTAPICKTMAELRQSSGN